MIAHYQFGTQERTECARTICDHFADTENLVIREFTFANGYTFYITTGKVDVYGVEMVLCNKSSNWESLPIHINTLNRAINEYHAIFNVIRVADDGIKEMWEYFRSHN